MTSPIRFDNSYARLPSQFFARVHPVPVSAPRLIKLNVELARQLNLNPEALNTQLGAEIFSGNHIATGSDPIALAYAGHQFGHFVPQLGDGRANLLGEVIATDGLRYDIQLKGSGPTPFSRRGDGRAALGPVLREYLLSEAMHALGVPTTRALAVVLTGEPVARETLQPGAIITRVAASHLRVGTFQFFAARNDTPGLRTLADYAIARHYPTAASSPTPYRTFLDSVITRHAHLTAQWMLLGFIHGVMNTDNSSISGETLDYGPCAFMEAYDPDTVYSSIDQQGRYGYRNQPPADLWNLARLTEAILPLLIAETGTEAAAMEAANDALKAYLPQYEAARTNGLRRKLGLALSHEDDLALAEDLLKRMTANQADFTLTFRRLCESAANPAADANVRTLFTDPAAYDTWATTWHHRLAEEPIAHQARAEAMRQTNPAIIPRNHLVQEVIDAATQHNNFEPFENLLEAITHPYDDRPHQAHYTTPAKPEQAITQTFCGT